MYNVNIPLKPFNLIELTMLVNSNGIGRTKQSKTRPGYLKPHNRYSEKIEMKLALTIKKIKKSSYSPIIFQNLSFRSHFAQNI